MVLPIFSARRLSVTAALIVLLIGCQAAAPEPSPSAPLPTLAPTATADVTADFVAYLNSNLGVALQHPPTWAIREGSTIQLASDAALFDNTAGVRSGALMAVAPVSISVQEGLGTALFDLVRSQGDVRIVTGPTEERLSGQEAATLRVLGQDAEGIPLSARYVLIRNQGAMILISGVTPDEATFGPVVEGIIRSVIISAPRPTTSPPTLTPAPTLPTAPTAATEVAAAAATPSEGTPAPQARFEAAVPADFVQYRHPGGLFSIGRPPDWLLNDEDQDAVLFASSDVLLQDNQFADGGGTVWIYPTSTLVQLPLDPVILLERFITNYPIYEGFNIVTAPTALEINGQQGATSRYEVTFAGAPLIADYYVVVSGPRVVFMVSLLAQDSFETLQPLVNGMVASLNMPPP